MWTQRLQSPRIEVFGTRDPEPRRLEEIEPEATVSEDGGYEAIEL